MNFSVSCPHLHPVLKPRAGHVAAACLALAALAAPCISAAPPSGVVAFQDSFASGAGGWQTTGGGEWAAAGGRYSVQAPDSNQRAIAVPWSAPFIGAQTATVTVRVDKRLATAGWSVVGLLIQSSPSELWLLGLTQDATGRRYVDFLEDHAGVWQAQSAQGPTHLTGGLQEQKPWALGKDYNLQLGLSNTSVTASVIDPVTGQAIATGSYDLAHADAVRAGSVGLYASGAAASFTAAKVYAPEAALAPPAGLPASAKGTVAMLRDTYPGAQPAAVDALAARLRAAGIGVTFISADQAADPAVLDPRTFPEFVVVGAEAYPASGAAALDGYLHRHGRLVLLGGPPFSRQLWKVGHEWLDQSSIAARLARIPAQHSILNVAPGQGVSNWTRNTNDPTISSSISAVAGPEGRGALQITMSGMTGWNTYRSSLAGAFGPGQDLLCFWARGDAKTQRLAVEMGEKDGSRWIGAAPITTNWTYHVMAPSDFPYWTDSHTTRPRGGVGDRFNPQNVDYIAIGLSSSHTPQAGPGPHTFWVTNFGTAANPYAGMDLSGGAFSPIETVTPSYKLYPLTNIASIRAAPHQTVLASGLTIKPTEAFSCIARAQGKGFGAHPAWRWIPLLQAFDANRQQRGTVAWMLLGIAQYPGSAVAVVGLKDVGAFDREPFAGIVINILHRMREGAFLTDGGSQYFAYWPRESVDLGATVANWSTVPASLSVRLSVDDASTHKRLFQVEASTALSPGSSMPVSRIWNPGMWTGEGIVTADLIERGQVVDRISHGISIEPDHKASPGQFIRTQGSEFILNGKPWNPVGVNFWPLYVSAAPDIGAQWLNPGYYDPEEVEKDLHRLSALGFNMVSIQMGGVDCSRNLVDFLRRCAHHGLHVNGFLQGASPVNFDGKLAASIVDAAHLKSNPTLFAYDIIWEPGNSLFNASGRLRWDRDWEAWILNRYGSIANAEADWGMPVPRLDGKVTSPSDAQMSLDGPWRIMVAAYRRFMDDLTSRLWGNAIRKLRRIDPNHLYSFRQGNTLPQDFAFTGPVKHIDFICPEGYSISGTGEEAYDEAGFINRYVHFTTGGKPIYWAEFGTSVWDSLRMEPNKADFPRQAAYLQLFYRAALDAGANGLSPWWWPGGYRIGERSDFGIMSPDGSPRPSALVVQRFSPRIQAPRAYPKSDTWLTIDRDANAGGYWHIVFNQGAQAYEAAHQKGQNLGIRTTGTGTSSCNTPLVAVGDVPCNGHNPPKYLDAEFNELQVLNRAGRWVDAADGAVIPVAAGKPVRCRVSVGNLQEAAWLSPASAGKQPGAVFLASAPGSDATVRRPIPANTPRFGDADFGEFTLLPTVAGRVQLALQMTAEGRAWFGEKRQFTLDAGP